MRRITKKLALLIFVGAVALVSFLLNHLDQGNQWHGGTSRGIIIRQGLITTIENVEGREGLQKLDQTTVGFHSKIGEGTIDLNFTEKYDYRGAQQDDRRLIRYIQAKILHPPNSSLPYNLRRPKAIDYSKYGQSQYANKTYLHGMRNGFFIEAGANDGEFMSKTLFFEKKLGWRGLLVEPLPHAVKRMLAKNRNAYIAEVALSNSTTANEAMLRLEGYLGLLSHLGDHGIPVKTIPLFSLLLALDVSIVDFFSLDVASYEFKVLRTIPWQRVKFRLMCVAVDNLPEGEVNNMIHFMDIKGYLFLDIVGHDAWFGWPPLLAQTARK